MGEKLMFAGILVALVTLAQGGPRQLTIHLQGASKREIAAVLVLEIDGGNMTRGTLLNPYEGRISDNYFWGELNGALVISNALTITGDSLSGFLATGKPYPATLSLDAMIDGSALSGTYEGNFGAVAEGNAYGLVEGVVPLADVESMVLFINTPHPGKNNDPRWNGWAARTVAVIDIKNGQPVLARVNYGAPRSTVFGATSGTELVPTAGGRSVPMSLPNGKLGTLQEITGAFNGHMFEVTLDIEQEGQIRSYMFKGTRIGNTLIGEYVIMQDDKETDHRNVFGGYLGKRDLDRPPLPSLDTLRDRLMAHLLWLYTDPYSGGLFRSDLVLTYLGTGGNKQYDNEPLVGASGAIGMSLLAGLTNDPDIKARAMAAARRAGYYLAAVRRGPLRLPQYYKGDFWLCFWMGEGFLDLYVATGDVFWLEQAKTLADTLHKTQTPEGTWNWVNEESGKTGKANHRHDRTWDDIPLHCGDWLHFLGRLRTEGETEAYADMEQRAAAWMAGAVKESLVHQGVDYLWLDRRPGDNPESIGPTFYALYLLKYSKEKDMDALMKTVTWVEDNMIVDGLVKEHQPRANSGLHAASSVRMALVYQLLAAKTGNDEYTMKAEALINHVMQLQNADTGLIWTGDLPSGWADYVGKDMHPYAVFKADMARMLAEYMCIKRIP